MSQRKSRSVLKFDQDGDVIARYPSVREAASENDIKYSELYSALIRKNTPLSDVFDFEGGFTRKFNSVLVPESLLNDALLAHLKTLTPYEFFQLTREECLEKFSDIEAKIASGEYVCRGRKQAWLNYDDKGGKRSMGDIFRTVIG